jgi:hypothetical protein
VRERATDRNRASSVRVNANATAKRGADMIFRSIPNQKITLNRPSTNMNPQHTINFMESIV